MLEVIDLSKRYGDVVALDGVSLSLRPGQLLGFLGPNGAGKTTTMRAILGLVALDRGTVRWDGRPITGEIRRRIGYMPAERGLYPKMGVREHVVYYARLAGLPKPEAERATDRWLERFGVADRAGSKVQDLSSGNMQRVQLALALVNDPDMLILDEPFSGLDPLAVEEMHHILSERVAAGAAALFSSHQLDLVEDVTEEVVIIDRGRIVRAGRVDDLRAALPARLVEVVGVDGTGWTAAIPGAEVVERRGHRVVVRVPVGADVAQALQAAQTSGTVQSFSFSPPPLSAVFEQAVSEAERAGRRAPAPGEEARR